jgi:hypothetical protein
MDPNVQCGLCLYCNSLLATVDGCERTSLWAKALSPLVDWAWFLALEQSLLDFVGVKTVLFCKDDILKKRVDGERWCKGSQNLFVWTVNDKEEKLEFARRGIPFFTDSPIRDMPEAWGPPSVPSYKRPLIALLVLLIAFLFIWLVM